MVKSRINKQTWMFIAVLVCLGIFLGWKAHYGYIFNDEPFMITLGHRLLKGDHFFVNEWNTTQLTAVFFAPVIYFYTKTTGSVEGLVLFCRIIYVIWWLFVGIVLYRRTKQYGWSSIVAVSVFLLYTPLDEMTLTYNAMALSLLVLFVSYFLTKGRTIFDYINGVVLAFAVLAYPSAMVVYIVYLLALIVKNVFKIKTTDQIARMLSWRVFIRITVSAAIVATILLGFIFCGRFSEALTSLRLILSFNSANSVNIIDLAKEFYDTFPFQTIFGLLLFLISLLDKQREKRAVLYFVAQVVIFIISMLFVLKNIYLFNVIMVPLAFVGIQAFILTNKKDSSALISFAIVGIVFAFCAFMTSDTGLMALSNGFVMIDIVSVIYIYQFYKEKTETSNHSVIIKLLSVSVACVFLLQFGSEGYIRFIRTYWDGPLPQLNTKISTGVAKGIITTEDNANYYENIYEDVLEIKKQTDDCKDLNFLSLSLLPSIYLDMDYNYGTNSSWSYTSNTLNFDALNEKLKLYYELNSSKIPNVIYINNSDLSEIDKISCIDFRTYREVDLVTGKCFIKTPTE